MKPLINFYRNLFLTIGHATPTQLTKQHKYEECYDVLKLTRLMEKSQNLLKNN